MKSQLNSQPFITKILNPFRMAGRARSAQFMHINSYTLRAALFFVCQLLRSAFFISVLFMMKTVFWECCAEKFYVSSLRISAIRTILAVNKCKEASRMKRNLHTKQPLVWLRSETCIFLFLLQTNKSDITYDVYVPEVPVGDYLRICISNENWLYWILWWLLARLPVCSLQCRTHINTANK